jgi:hypothetical protein
MYKCLLHATGLILQNAYEGSAGEEFIVDTPDRSDSLFLLETEYSDFFVSAPVSH